MDQVGTANFVSKLDLLKGYWQVPLSPRAREVTSFITPSGLYSYSVMSFGLRNAPATFQRLINRVVFGLEGCAVYLDDVIVFSETWEQHLVRLRALLTRLAEACLTVNLAKCEFVAKATVRYLGKEVGQSKVHSVQAKVLAIQQFPSPSTKKELMRFLGMVGYYRGLCSNFSTVVSPLTDLLKSSVKFDWSENCQRAFENVKLLTTAPVLAAPRLDMPFKLQVDASQVGAGAVLLQTGENGLDYPVSFFSRKFNTYQKHYSVIEKEALSLIWALQFFDVYVGGGMPVEVFSDHNPHTFFTVAESALNALDSLFTALQFNC